MFRIEVVRASVVTMEVRTVNNIVADLLQFVIDDEYSGRRRESCMWKISEGLLGPPVSTADQWVALYREGI